LYLCNIPHPDGSLHVTQSLTRHRLISRSKYTLPEGLLFIH